MIERRSIAFSAVIITGVVAIAAICFSVRLKLFAKANQPPPITASTAMESDRVAVGQNPRALLTITDVGNRSWVGFGNPENYLVHVEGKYGELPKRDLKVSSPGIRDDLPPGMSRTMKCELSSFYNLSVPGEYTVYFEVQEEPGVWLRTNTANFAVIAPNH